MSLFDDLLGGYPMIVSCPNAMRFGGGSGHLVGSGRFVARFCLGVHAIVARNPTPVFGGRREPVPGTPAVESPVSTVGAFPPESPLAQKERSERDKIRD